MTDDIKKLTPYQHVRLRTTVYYGSTNLHTGPVLSYDNGKVSVVETSWVPAVFTLVREILDNSLDELVAHGYGNRITIKYDPATSIFEVEDNGRGIPIDWDDEHHMYKATLALSELMSGRNFDSRVNTAGMNGIGASGVNFCSEYFNVDIHRDDKHFIQTFREGSEMFDELQISKPKISKKLGKTGTKITFKLSNTVFSDLTLPEKFVKDRIIEIANCNPQIQLVFNGELIKTKPTISKSLFADYTTMSIMVDSADDTFHSQFLLIPNIVESGEHTQTLVNNIPTFNGGTHVDSFKKYFIPGLLSALEKENKKRGLTPNRSDIFEHLLIFNTTKMAKPDFDSQSKTRLITDGIDKHIKLVLENETTFKNIIKQNKEWIDSIYERCEERTQKKDDADIAKKNRKILRNKVPKLADANGKDRSKCIIFICEGDSAVSQIMSVRDPEIYGALPLRGKILNVRGKTPKVVIENEIISDIMAALGISLGKKAIRSDMRYGKIYLAADQDPDGANITALLINFFYLHWPELFDIKQSPVFYAFQTPFIIQEKGKKRYYWYANDYQTYNGDDWKGCPKPTRAKGLGSLEEVDWIHSLANPKLIPITDDGNLSEALDLIFSKHRADDRKEWMSL